MKLTTQHFLAGISHDAMDFWRKGKPLFLLLLFSFQGAFSQTGKLNITGTVKDSAGAALPGVTITEKGARNGTSTDADGNFEV